MTNLAKTEKAIVATKACTKALMKLSYKNYISTAQIQESRISDKNKKNLNY